jgi:hypothetical protein
MKRVAVILVGVAVVAIAAFVAGSRWERRGERPTAASDSLWYHASDVSQLASTGRPQLVEFFHPG